MSYANPRRLRRDKIEELFEAARLTGERAAKAIENMRETNNWDSENPVKLAIEAAHMAHWAIGLKGGKK